MTIFPQTRQLKKLGEICTFINGKAFKPSEWSKQGLPIVRIQNLNRKDAPFNYCDFEVKEKFHINNGDLLISRSGTPGTSFGAFIWEGGDAVLNQHIFNTKFDGSIVDKVYLKYAVNNILDEMIYHSHGGAGLKHITKGKLESIAIPLPPLSTQKAIVAKLDEISTSIQQAKGEIEQQIEKVDELWMSTMEKEFSGNYDLFSLSDDSVVQIIDGDRGKQYPKKTDFSDKGYCLFLNTSNVRKGYFDFTKLDFITKERDELLRKGKLQENDIILTTRGTIGNCAFFKKTGYAHARINSGMVILRTNSEKIEAQFLLQLLLSPVFTDQVKTLTSGSAQPQLPIGTMKRIILPLPKKNKQIEIIKNLMNTYNHCKRLKEQYQSQLTHYEQLRASTLDQAFSGKLVA